MGSKGSRFYCPLHTTRVIESDRAIYFEDDTGTREGPREIVVTPPGPAPDVDVERGCHAS